MDLYIHAYMRTHKAVFDLHVSTDEVSFYDVWLSCRDLSFHIDKVRVDLSLPRLKRTAFHGPASPRRYIQRRGQAAYSNREAARLGSRDACTSDLGFSLRRFTRRLPFIGVKGRPRHDSSIDVP